MEDNHLEVTRTAVEARENDDAVRIPMGSDSDSSSNSDSGSDSSSGSGSVSNLDLNVHPDSESDGDSATSDVTNTELDSFTDVQLVRVNEGDEQDQFVRQRFVDVMFALGLRTVVETLYKNFCTTLTWRAKQRAFLTMSLCMEEKIGKGCGVAKYAWFGGSRDEIINVFRYGFASRGRGVCLSPFYSPLGSVRGCVADENGLCHLILCRVVLGRSELVSADSEQRFPSSEEFHSGVDNLSSPRVYLIWSTHMNTHILPQYVFSFKRPVPVKGKGAEDAAAGPATGREPNRLIPFPVLLRELAMVLPIDTITTLQKLHRDYRDGKIVKLEMARKLKQLAGNDLLYRTIISLKRKDDASEQATPRDSNNVVLPRQSGLRPSANRVLKKLRGARSG